MDRISSEDMDYILQVISNSIRRDVIRVLAKDSPLSYSVLMKRVGVDDSGTFGFHIRKMQRLLKKDDMGMYMLNKLGVKAYEILESLMGGEAIEEEKPEEREEVEARVEEPREAGAEPTTIVISDKLRFDLTEEIARSYREKGRRLYITDVVKLVIHPMPKELFDDVVEGISDCISIQAPDDLLDLVKLKSSDVLSVKGSSGLSLRDTGVSSVGDIVGDVVSRILSATASITSRLISLTHIGGVGVGRQELVIDEQLSIPPDSRLVIDISGGYVKVKPGEEGRIRVWKTSWKDPEVDVDIRDEAVNIDVSGGKCELTIPEGYVYGVSSDMSGGVLVLKMPMLREVDIGLSGGVAKFSSSTESPLDLSINMNGGMVNGSLRLGQFTGESKVECELNGGAVKLSLEVPEDTRVGVDNRTFGGFANVRIDNKTVSNKFTEPGFEESSRRLKLRSELMGGILTIDITRKRVE